MTIIAVSTAQELMGALESANGGDRIELAAGDYGDFYFQKTSFDARVTIASADPNDMATFNTLHLNFVENVTVEHVFIDHASSTETQNFESALKVGNSAQIKIDDVVFEGELVAHYPDGAGTEPVMLPVGRAASIFNSEDITFSNNDVSVFRSGVNVTYTDGITISDNEIYNVRSSGTGGSVINDLVLTGNHFHDFEPYGNPSTDGDHSGFVHYWTKDDQEGPNTNFYIANNFFEVGGDGSQDNSDSRTGGINLDDNAREIGFENVLIENNVLHMAATMGIGVENGVGVVLRDNTLLQSGGEERKAPGIMIIGEISDHWLIEDNIVTEVDGVGIRSMTKDIDTLNITLRDNLHVQRFNPEADNYVGDLFVNALTPNGELSDFRAIPGSLAADVGAQHLRPNGETSLVVISAKANDGLETLSVSVSVEDLLGDLSQAEIDAMSIIWDFGDGSTGTGNDLVHTYASTGAYKISGLATAQDGTTFELNKVVEVKTPNGIDVRFDTGIRDISDTQNDVLVTGNAQLVNTASGKALQLSNSDARVKFDANDELSNNPSFTLSFDFKYDNDSQSGFALYFPGAAIIQLNNGEIKLTGKTSLNEAIDIRSSALRLDDSAWHRVSYVLSQATGTATLYIDGTMVGNIFGLEGIQPPSQSHGLTLGSPFGKSFTGQLDNVSFLRAALSEDDIELLHSGANVSLSDLEGISEPEPTPPLEPEVSEPESTGSGSGNTPPDDVQIQDPVSPEPEDVEPQVQTDTSSDQPTSEPQKLDDTQTSEPTIALAQTNQNIDTASIAKLNPGITEDVLQGLALQFSSFTTSDEHHSSGGWLEWVVRDDISTGTSTQPVDAIGVHLFGGSAQSSVRQERALQDVAGGNIDQFLVAEDSFDFFG